MPNPALSPVARDVARITVVGRTQPPGVFSVVAQGHGFEQWPSEIDRIELAAMRLDPVLAAPVCE